MAQFWIALDFSQEHRCKAEGMQTRRHLTRHTTVAQRRHSETRSRAHSPDFPVQLVRLTSCI
jgi:hypothetical protein